MKKTFNKPFFSTLGHRSSHKPGISLLIAIIMVGILTIFGLTVTNVVISSIRNSANVNRANEAYYAAEGGLEKGLLENQQGGSAYSSSLTTSVPYCTEGQTNCPLRAAYSVQGQVPVNSVYEDAGSYTDMYGIPAPGSGNAVGGCNPLEAVKSGDEFTYNGETYDDPAPDHPCNWSRIRVGQTVSIPLYTNTADCSSNPAGDGICDPVDLGLDEIIVRLRTPCADSAEMCESGNRLDLDDLNGEPAVNGNDTIVDWQIVGTNAAGDKVYTMVPDRTVYGIGSGQDAGTRKQVFNSEIYESLLNTANSFESLVIRTGSGGKGGRDISTDAPLHYISYFLRNEGQWGLGGTYRPNDPNDAIHKPILKLTVVRNLTASQAEGGVTIPYLEYQVLTSTGVGFAPTDSSQTIRSEGYSGSFRHVMEVKQPQETGLLEYVIQQ